MARYRVLQGIDYPPNKRAEVGDTVDDLPANAVKWLLDTGAIEDPSKPKKVEVVVEETPAPVVEETPTPVIEESPVVVEEGFDPDATDGDGDGFLQDGTVHQRPVEETK